MVSDAARVKSIFLAAVERYPAEQWPAYLDEACGEDAELRQRVERLLGAHGGQRSLHLPLPSPPEETVARPAVERPGEMVGPYKLREQIGEGGMGVVYVAEQTHPVRRRVALKIIKPGMDTKQVIARFEAERQALAMMDHPNIAKVHDAGTTESGRPYFVMELVRGMPITDYCDRERLSIPERLELFVLVCRAVQHAHQKGIIHRDLKPSNILVTVIDGAAVPKIIDFGVAKATGGALTERTLYTAFHQFVGTPLYMSPEQADLSGMDMDTRSDIYSLGVLLYELLTGTTPFDQETFRTAAFDELRRIIREQEPPKPSTRLSSLGATRATVSANRQADARHLDRAIRGELDWIVMKSLEKDRRRRYETANDFAADVVRYLTDKPVEACPPSVWYRFSKYARRNRGTLVASAVVGLALVAGTALATWQAIRATQARTLATKREREAQTAAAEATQARTLATKREREAQTAAAESQRAAAESKAVLTFLVQDMLGAAAPHYERGLNVKVPEALAKGRDTKVVEVLANAEKKIDTAFPNQPLVEAGVRHALASTRMALGQYDLALRHASRSYELRRDLLGLEHPETLASMEMLAHELKSVGNSNDSRKLFDQALEIRRRILGPEHPDTLRSMAWVAGELEGQGKTDEAYKLLGQTLEMQRRILGPEHVSTLHSRVGLAIMLSRQHGKLDDARQLLEQILEIQRRVLGPENPFTLQSMHRLGSWLQQQGNLDESRKLWEQTLEIRRRVEPEHPDTFGLMLGLADILSAQGNFPRAIKLAQEAAASGRENPAWFWDKLAMVYYRVGDRKGSIAAREKAWALRIEQAQKAVASGPDNAIACNNLAWYLATVPDLQLRNIPRAIELAQRAVKLQPDAGGYWNTLGVVYYRAGKWKEAIAALDKSLALKSGNEGFDWIFLAMAHQQLGENDMARAWYDKAVAWMEKNAPRDLELVRFRAEAAALLGVNDLPADVFARP